MKRRQFIQTAGAGTLGAIAGFSLFRKDNILQAATNPITIEWLGHTCFSITGGGIKVLVNPYKDVGCTAGYKAVFPQADVALITSQLFDEGFVDGLQGAPKILWQAGQYAVKEMTFNGLLLDHANTERYRGWRYPPNVAWSWTQGGVNILHLGGAGEELEIEEFILNGGSPDVVIIPVGGTEKTKGYTPQQALKALELLNPKIVLPSHYLTEAATETCLLSPLDEFIESIDPNQMSITNVASNRLQVRAGTLSQSKPEVKLLNDGSLLKK